MIQQKHKRDCGSGGNGPPEPPPTYLITNSFTVASSLEYEWCRVFFALSHSQRVKLFNLLYLETKKNIFSRKWFFAYSVSK